MESSPPAGAALVSLDQFVKWLTDSGLMTTTEIRTLAARVPLPQRTDCRPFVQELIKQQKLTRYQATMLMQGKTRGLVIAKYVILDKLGQGGMGMVFKARDVRLDRVIALKVLPPAVTTKPGSVQRFQREVQAASKLNHPNIVAAYDAGEEKGVHFLVMEYVDGIDLLRQVRTHGPLPVREAVDYVLQAARGLEHAHAAGIIHRDIKPSNLLVSGRVVSGQARTHHSPLTTHQVKILDMGLARFEEGTNAPRAAEDLTQSGSMLGTTDYMAPEQALNSRNADQRADIYSLGCTLYYLLTATTLYGGETPMEKLLAHREAPIPSLRAVRPDVSPKLEELYRRMVAKAPEARHPSARELIADLEACLASAGTGTAAVTARAPTPAGKRHTAVPGSTQSEGAPPVTPALPVASLSWLRLPARIWLGVGAAALVIVLAAFAISRMGSSKTEPDKPAPPPGDDPALAAHLDPQWLKTVAGLSPEKQVESVAAKLKERNPQFNGKVSQRIEAGAVVELSFYTDNVTDIWPVRALARLQTLGCTGTRGDNGVLADMTPLTGSRVRWLDISSNPVADLRPLRGVPLQTLNCSGTRVADLSPLKGMPLATLDVSGTRVSDLGPLQGMPLTALRCERAPVTSLGPLAGMKLTDLRCGNNKGIANLAPLQGMPLTYLSCQGTSVSDLAPLRGMPLTYLELFATRVSDLTPLQGAPLTYLNCSRTSVSDLTPLQGMKLTDLRLAQSRVADLTPLQGMLLTTLHLQGAAVTDLSTLKESQLKHLTCDFKPDRDAEVLRSIKTLETINGANVAKFWRQFPALKP